MSDVRDFDLGDVLSVTTGRLVSPRHIAGVYDILGHVTGERLMTHQLPRACDQAKPGIIEQHPDLADVDVPSGLDSEEKVMEWLAVAKQTYGETRPIAAVPTENPPDPIEELIDKVGPERANRIYVLPEQPQWDDTP